MKTFIIIIIFLIVSTLCNAQKKHVILDYRLDTIHLNWPNLKDTLADGEWWVYRIENKGHLYGIWRLWERCPDNLMNTFLDSLQKYDTPLIIANYKNNVKHGKSTFYEIDWEDGTGGRRETIYNYGKKIKYTVWNKDSVITKEECFDEKGNIKKCE